MDPHSKQIPLVVVVPVYNEEDCIVAVLEEWRTSLRQTLTGFCLLVINDGSTDQTAQRLSELEWPELRVHHQVNRGHGQSCLVGYRLAHEIGAEYVFQIDSDGQCDPQGFAELWRNRDKAVAVYGRRVVRDDGNARKVITVVLRKLLKALHHTQLNDTNVPFRLYRTSIAAAAASLVPQSFDLANIAIALLLEPKGFIEVPIHFRDRLGGHPSVKWWGFARKAQRLLKDLRTLPRRID